MRHYGFVVLSLLAGALLLGAAQAGATDYSIKGAIENFCCTNPGPTPGGKNLGGNPPGRGGFNPVGGQIHPGVVQQTGTGTPNSPLSLKFPADIMGTTTSIFIPNHPVPIFYTFSVMFTNANEAGTLVKSGGAGDFSFCPVAVGPGVGSCTAPSQAAPSPKNGRIFGQAGPNKFGGTMRLLGPSLYGKVVRVSAPGAPSKTNVHFNAPFGLAMGQSKVGATVPVPETSYMVSSMGVKGPIASGIGSMAGAPWSTGYMLIQITKNANPPVRSIAITGSDNRSSMGQGNITLVTPSLHNNGLGAPSTNPLGNKMVLTLPEPGSGLSVAVGALMLSLIGLMRARRKR